MLMLNNQCHRRFLISPQPNQSQGTQISQHWKTTTFHLSTAIVVCDDFSILKKSLLITGKWTIQITKKTGLNKHKNALLTDCHRKKKANSLPQQKIQFPTATQKCKYTAEENPRIIFFGTICKTGCIYICTELHSLQYTVFSNVWHTNNGVHIQITILV